MNISRISLFFLLVAVVLAEKGKESHGRTTRHSTSSESPTTASEIWTSSKGSSTTEVSSTWHTTGTSEASTTTEQFTTSEASTTTKAHTTTTEHFTTSKASTTTEATTTNSPTTPEIITVPDVTSPSTPSEHTKIFPVSTETTKPTTSHTTSTPTPSSPSPSPTKHTTTSKPTTHPTNGTTSRPTTTTERVPTTPAYPDHLPAKAWSVSYNEKKDNYCILAEFEARVIIVYENVVGDTVSTGFAIPTNASVDMSESNCGQNSSKTTTSQSISLKFDFHVPGGLLKLSFHRNASKIDVDEVLVRFELTPEMFPGLPAEMYHKLVTVGQMDIDVFKAKEGHSYSCSSTMTNLTQINILGKEDNSLQQREKQQHRIKYSLFEAKSVHVQAFMSSGKHEATFLPADVCPGDLDTTSDTVPIVVGVVLLSLVVIVMAAYFIGRLRSNRSLRFTEI